MINEITVISSRPDVICKIVVLKNFINSTRKHLYQNHLSLSIPPKNPFLMFSGGIEKVSGSDTYVFQLILQII